MSKLIKLLDNICDFGNNRYNLGEPRYGILKNSIYINIDSISTIDIVDNDNSNIFKFEGHPINRNNIVKKGVYSLTRISIKDSNRLLYTTEQIESLIARIND